MTDSSRQTLQEALGSLRAEYARELPSKLAELEAAVSLAEQSPNDPWLMRDARMRAHSLKGTAGSYGFKALGAAAARLEDALGHLEAGRRTAADPAWSEVREALQGCHRGFASDPPIT